jgi:hypothetical protein
MREIVGLLLRFEFDEGLRHAVERALAQDDLDQCRDVAADCAGLPPQPFWGQSA